MPQVDMRSRTSSVSSDYGDIPLGERSANLQGNYPPGGKAVDIPVPPAFKYREQQPQYPNMAGRGGPYDPRQGGRGMPPNMARNGSPNVHGGRPPAAAGYNVGPRPDQRINPNGMPNNGGPAAQSRMPSNSNPAHQRMNPHGNGSPLNPRNNQEPNGHYGAGYNAPGNANHAGNYDANYYAEYGTDGGRQDNYGNGPKSAYDNRAANDGYGAAGYQGHNNGYGGGGYGGEYNADYYSDYNQDYGGQNAEYTTSQPNEHGYKPEDYANVYNTEVSSPYGSTAPNDYGARYTPAPAPAPGEQGRQQEPAAAGYGGFDSRQTPTRQGSSTSQRPQQNGQYANLTNPQRDLAADKYEQGAAGAGGADLHSYAHGNPSAHTETRANGIAHQAPASGTSTNGYGTAPASTDKRGGSNGSQYDGGALATTQSYSYGNAKVISTGSSNSSPKKEESQQDQPPQSPAPMRTEAEAERMLQEQKKLDLERLQKQLETLPPKAKKPVLEKLAIFGAKNKKVTPSQPNTPSTVNTTVFSPAMSRGSSLETSPPDGMNAVPDELPMSAISAVSAASVGAGSRPSHDVQTPVTPASPAKRYVTVKWQTSTITLAVTKETTSMDILWAAAKALRNHLSPASCLLMECYVGLGLERRIRRYELMHDIMNSWDRDTENSLLILPSGAGQSDFDLDIGSVSASSEGPTGFNLQFYHSNVAGKWNKRYISLRRNGQVVSCKREDFDSNDRDVSNIFHMSEFDIYYPKEAELRQIRPPKHYCYVIKNQHKRNALADPNSFLHYVCTDDEAIARRFHEAVHAWRSWFLVNQHLRLEIKPATVGSNNKTTPFGSTRNREPVIEATSFDVGKLDLSGHDIFAPKKDPPKPVEDTPATPKYARFGQDTMGQNYSSLIPPASSPMENPSSATSGYAVPASAFSRDPVAGARYGDRGSPASRSVSSNSKPKKAPSALAALFGSKSKSKEPEPEELLPEEDPSFVVHIPPPPPVVELPPPPPPEPQSWFPSATAHSAQNRSQSLEPVVHVSHKVIVNDTSAEVAAGAWINFDDLLADDPPVRPAVSDINNILESGGGSPASAPATTPYTREQQGAYNHNSPAPNRGYNHTNEQFGSPMQGHGPGQQSAREYYAKAHQGQGQRSHPQHPHAQQYAQYAQQQHAHANYSHGGYSAQEPASGPTPVAMRRRSKSAAAMTMNPAVAMAAPAAGGSMRSRPVDRPAVPNMPADSYMSAPVNNPFTRGRDRRAR